MGSCPGVLGTGPASLGSSGPKPYQPFRRGQVDVDPLTVALARSAPIVPAMRGKSLAVNPPPPTADRTGRRWKLARRQADHVWGQTTGQQRRLALVLSHRLDNLSGEGIAVLRSPTTTNHRLVDEWAAQAPHLSRLAGPGESGVGGPLERQPRPTWEGSPSGPALPYSVVNQPVWAQRPVRP